MHVPLPSRLLKTPFSTQDALVYGVSKSALSRHVKAGILDRLSRGVYQLSEKNEGLKEDRYHTATLRCGTPSAICLLSALEHYHLTDQISKQTWILVPHAKRVRSAELKLIRSRMPQWDVGIRKNKHYWITTLERTLIDVLVYKRFLGSQIGIEGIKQALAQKKVNLGKLYDLAKKMEVLHQIQPYLEALAS